MRTQAKTYRKGTRKENRFIEKCMSNNYSSMIHIDLQICFVNLCPRRSLFINDIFCQHLHIFMHLHIIPLSLAGVDYVRGAGGLQLELATLLPGDTSGCNWDWFVVRLDLYSFTCSIRFVTFRKSCHVFFEGGLYMGPGSQLYLRSGFGLPTTP